MTDGEVTALAAVMARGMGKPFVAGAAGGDQAKLSIIARATVSARKVARV
jgi:hypothetical protein